MSSEALRVTSPRWGYIVSKTTGGVIGMACNGCGKWQVNPATHICLTVDDWHEQFCKVKKDE